MASLSTFKKGDVLFRQGDPCLNVLLVRSGEVEVVREISDDTVVLGHVREGEWLGEMSVFENRIHSATARAATDVGAEVLTAHQFLNQVSGDAALARELILRLSARLRRMNDRISAEAGPIAQRHKQGETGATTTGQTAITLIPQNRELRSRIGAERIRITNFPFVVGRVPLPEETEPARCPDLQIRDDVPFRLSRDHFAILQMRSGFSVSDLGSALGTIVNGKPIGSHFMQDSASLQRGENRVTAGGQGSPFDFVILIE
ncbi:cyclic nucleotide-binding domain-containing protein [Reyranella sp.]|uniref:cyclic nucleotide-binding domain-containing protein n=1 Tax=Reyranella sp. TaxID=1929291 RepID=UPI00272F2C48|nr:cyclic nucleotide-binding domain-containing protein [Reyranella sp.]MDP2377333.1 cyclic nucleotide-binding domain-containing protein [Reyranella sp.]